MAGFCLAAGGLARRSRAAPAAPAPTDAVNLAVTGMAALGVVLAGSPHAHEALLALPAIASGLAWPWVRPHWLSVGAAAALAVALLCTPAAFAPEGPRESLQWLPIAALALLVAGVRTVVRLPSEAA